MRGGVGGGACFGRFALDRSSESRSPLLAGPRWRSGSAAATVTATAAAAIADALLSRRTSTAGEGGGWRYLQKQRAYQRRWYRIAY